MPIVPDEKDWTWVLERVCPECGFETADIDRGGLPGRIRVTSDAWEAILRGASVQDRPDDDTWSPLEYACHVRDVHEVYAGRISRMLAEDDPHYESWDQDVTAIDEAYREQAPDVVALELREAAERVMGLVTDLDAAQWDRTGRRSDGASFTVDSIGRYYLHDIEHHIWDVTGSLPSRQR
jgi:hypothetical protein